MKLTTDFERRVSELIEASIVTKQSMLSSSELVLTVAKVSEILVRALKQGNKVLLFGNGGSAADAQHIAAELVGRFALDRPALPALALSVNTSCVTAIGNDYGFDQVFSRQIEALARPGDVAIGISIGGNSANVLRAMLAARKMGLHTIALTGRTGGIASVSHRTRVRGFRNATSLSAMSSLNLWRGKYSVKRAAFLDHDEVMN